MDGCPFGLGAVVVQFNRYPALLVAFARRAFALLTAAYFDDCIQLEPQQSAAEANNRFKRIMGYLGTPPNKKKNFDMASHRVFLGAAITAVRIQHDTSVVIAPKEATRTQVMEDLSLAICTCKLTSAQAAKVRGRSGWLASNSFGRIGRLGQAVLKKVQYVKNYIFTDQDAHALRFHREVASRVPPRSIPLNSKPCRPLVLYTDAMFTEGFLPKLGILLFRDPPLVPIGLAMVLPLSLVSTWRPRKQQIFPAETAAGPIAFAALQHDLQGRDVVLFVDNEAAVSTLIRGTSCTEDSALMAELLHTLCLILRCRLWVEWIDSDSNPSDGLSRDGLSD